MATLEEAAATYQAALEETARLIAEAEAMVTEVATTFNAQLAAKVEQLGGAEGPMFIVSGVSADVGIAPNFTGRTDLSYAEIDRQAKAWRKIRRNE
jgi:hypothetical protein